MICRGEEMDMPGPLRSGGECVELWDYELFACRGRSIELRPVISSHALSVISGPFKATILS
jgi:hypothetical protein